MKIMAMLLVIMAMPLSISVIAQGQTGQMPSMGTMGGAGAGPGGGMGGMMSPDMMAMMQSMHPAITVDDTAIYIVRGNQLLKYDKRTLQLLSEATLPEAAMTMPSGGTAGGGMGRGPMQPMQMTPEMQQMMNRMQGLSPLQFDRSFLENMERHHEGAIIMSRLALQKAVHPQLRQFAQKVINSQSSQNREFNTWLTNWYGVSISPSPMPEDQSVINRLQDLSGRDFEILYMRHMITHHSGAIAMSQMAEQKASHPELKQTAMRIIQDQSAEINQLKSWLSTWYGVQV